MLTHEVWKAVIGIIAVIVIIGFVFLVNYGSGKKDIMSKSAKRHNY